MCMYYVIADVHFLHCDDSAYVQSLSYEQIRGCLRFFSNDGEAWYIHIKGKKELHSPVHHGPPRGTSRREPLEAMLHFDDQQERDQHIKKRYDALLAELAHRLSENT